METDYFFSKCPQIQVDIQFTNYNLLDLFLPSSVTSSKFRNKPLNSSLEGTFLARLDLRVCHVAPNGKSMCATFPELAFVAWSELTIPEKLVSLLRRFEGELLVNWTRVDEKGCLRGCEVFLTRSLSKIPKLKGLTSKSCLEVVRNFEK